MTSPPALQSSGLKNLRNLLTSIAIVDAVHDSDALHALLTRCLQILDIKLLPEENSRRPFIAVVSGGTNVGKSSLLNWLADAPLSPVSALARGTRSPVATGSGAVLDAFMESGAIPGVRMVRDRDAREAVNEPSAPAMFLVETSAFSKERILLIDSPDVDSDHEGNRIWAGKLLDLADAVILVVTPEKYNDAAIVRFLDAAVELNRTTLAVFNKSEGTESFEDFRNNVLCIRIPDAVCLAIPRFSSKLPVQNGDIAAVRKEIRQLSDDAAGIRKKSGEGSRALLASLCHDLADGLGMQAEWVRDVRVEIDTISDTILSRYILQLKQEKFTEFDRVFALLMQQFHIAILDDIYSFVRSNLRKGYDLLRRPTAAGNDERDEAIQSRERHRAEGAATEARNQMLYLPIHVPMPIRSLVEQWVADIDSRPLFEMEHYERDVREAAEKWVREESRNILETIGDRKGIRYLVTSAKAFLQLGSGVLSAFLTGGLSPIDAVVVPATERLAAFLIEKGVGRPYFRLRQNQFYELRRTVLKGHLDRMIFDPIRARIPDLPLDQATRIRSLAGNLMVKDEA